MSTATRKKPGARSKTKAAPKGKAKGQSHAGKPATARKPRGKEPTRSQPLDLEIDAEVLEFIEAIDRFKLEHARPFPSWSEVLHILRALGYQKP